MSYSRMLISEAEKRRIKHIHNVSRRNEFRNLLKEQGEYNPGVDVKVAEWFKTKIGSELPGFPTDGYAYSIEDPASPGTMVTVWEVLNPDNNLKYYLFPDGRAQNAKGEMSTNKWHTGPAPTFDEAIKDDQVAQAETGTGREEVKIDPNMSPEDVRKQAQDAAKKKVKEQKAATKENVKNCIDHYNYYKKLTKGRENKLNKLMQDPTFKAYVDQAMVNIEGCCAIFDPEKNEETTKNLGVWYKQNLKRYSEKVKEDNFCKPPKTTQQQTGTPKFA